MSGIPSLWFAQTLHLFELASDPVGFNLARANDTGSGWRGRGFLFEDICPHDESASIQTDLPKQ